MRPTPDAQPVDDCLRRASAGDDGAWRQIVETYSRRVYGLLYKQCRDRELAEELTQETFVKMVRAVTKSDGYQERGRFESWLFRIAMNGLRDEMRRRQRQAVGRGNNPADEAGPDPIVALADTSTPDPLDNMTHQEQLASLRDCMQRLNDADREVLHLRHTAGLSFQQIAEALEKPLGTVLARAHRATGKLRKMMTEGLNEVDAA
ncbi:RNA polymerase sigma factor [Mucisphaera calidilacus]|uniref:ECF RNA polymerase sigma factor SigW n=1 Tax=Mucisphaera calidilacus TaxID=2527982 RepID=A0A518BZX7_9BACT|nr:sigma-70 family RNA polymerase sigma factor [Mucisphaera calidilacus]QDU72521.1 ECF RNA polymerase sigma factor SigW [Mucisphaera calidilacus]